MVEGPGHVPYQNIVANVQLEKRLCGNAPFYVLGPLPSDFASGYDHICGAIGASLAAAAGLWARLSFSPRFSQVLAVLLLAWFWLDRLILTRNPQPFASHLFPLVLSVLLLGFVWICAWLLEPFMRGQPAMTGSIEEETPDEP